MRTTNIPPQVETHWRRFACLLRDEQDISDELLTQLRNFGANYDPFCIVEMQRFNQQVNGLEQPAIGAHLIRLRETYLEMTPMHDYRYGERYGSFRFRIGNVPFNLDHFGPKPSNGEIQADTKEYVEERLELHDNYQAQTNTVVAQRDRALQETLDCLFAAQLQIQAVEQKRQQIPHTNLFHSEATTGLTRENKTHEQVVQQLATQFQVSRNDIWNTEIVEQVLVAMAGIYTSQHGNACFRQQDEQTTYFILQFENGEEMEQCVAYYRQHYAHFIIGHEPLAQNRYKIMVNTSTLYHQVAPVLGSFHKNSHRNLMQQFMTEMQADAREVTHGVIVEQRLMDLAGIQTEQTDAQFRRNTCYATDFKLRFTDAEEFQQFIEYYQQRMPGLILKTSYQADAFSTISMDTTKLYMFASELRPETSIAVPGC